MYWWECGFFFSQDTASCPAQIITAVSLWSCSAVWKVKKEMSDRSKWSQKDKKIYVQVHNKGGEKCFGFQDWMSSPAGLGPDRQGSDENTPWMFLEPMDTQSTDETCWSSSLHLAAQFLMHNKSMQSRNQGEKNLKTLIYPVLSSFAAVWDTGGGAGGRWGSRVALLERRELCQAAQSRCPGFCGRWMSSWQWERWQEPCENEKKGAAARGEGVNSSLLQLTPQGSSSHCWASH